MLLTLLYLLRNHENNSDTVRPSTTLVAIYFAATAIVAPFVTPVAVTHSGTLGHPLRHASDYLRNDLDVTP